jgi:glycosyltransferase involved in cell wall biosynthesis
VLNQCIKIGVVAYEMEGDRSGVGRFLEGVLGGLRGVDHAWEWLLYFQGEPFDHPLWHAAPGQRCALRPIFDGRPAAKAIWWEQTRLPDLLAAADLDLVFSPAYSLPSRGDLPGILTLHDLSFEHRPGEFGFKERWRRRLLARWGARHAARVLTTSSDSYDDLRRTYRVPAERLRLLPLAVDEKFRAARHPTADEQARRRAVLAEIGVCGPYALWLATLLPRRRVDWAIAAFAALAQSDPDLRLVVAGADRLPGGGELDAWTAASGVGPRIVRLDYVPEALVPALYAEAELSFYLSSFEGFGLPPLESLAAGTPAVVTPGIELDRLWPDYPLRAEDAAGVAAKAAIALGGLDRAAFLAEADQRLAHLTWRRCAELLVSEIAACLPVGSGRLDDQAIARESCVAGA